MMRWWTAAVVMLAVVALPSCRREAVSPEKFSVEVINGFTPVKDQKGGSVCWAYAMLAAIETGRIMQGDSVHLSVDYALRKHLERAFRWCYLSGGAERVSARGTAMTLVNAIMEGGVVSYDACHGGMAGNVDILARKVERMSLAAVNGKWGLARCESPLRRLLDESLGFEPRSVFMLGASYTPQEFARSVCAPGEYVAFTSFTHHPFYTYFALEVADNYECDMYYNLPIDTLMARMEDAVRAGRGVCWEGDVSEPGFSFAEGVARLPQGTSVSQADRQRAFERFDTTDDHCMAVVGLARDSCGHRYFIMKNSWGTDNPYGGLVYVAEDYVRLKTVAVVMGMR